MPVDEKTFASLNLKTLAAEFEAAGDFASYRKALLKHFKEFYKSGREEIDRRIFNEPNNCAQFRFDYAHLTDEMIGTLYALISEYVYPLSNPTTSERMSLMAVGGYGRGEMAPFSDVDILFLIPYKQTAWHENVIETMLYFLWDMGLKIGQSVRSIDESLTLASQDVTIRTSLLEMRHVAGDAELAGDLAENLRKKLFDKTVAEFVELKLEEREKRHDKSGNIRYVLEPNVKEAKGGLRDLQTLYWLGKYITAADSAQELIEEGFFLPEEEEVFRDSESFLWGVRMILHLLAKRANDILSFDMQVEVARALGYEDDTERRGVEYFMQDYFRNARQVGELTRVFITALEARHLLSSPLQKVSAIWKNLRLPDEYEMLHGRISFVDPDIMIEKPIEMLRIFQTALETGYLIHPDVFRVMARHGELIDDKFRENREANRLFMSLLLDYGNPERALRRMNELGLLGAFIPEWKRIDAMMQYNMYHSYTVDEHSIQCISVLAELEAEKLLEDLPVASGILKAGVNRRVLYAAVLFHDIGKGQARPHEEVGAEFAKEICPRLGFEPYETEMVSWLILHHLDMSDAAQKRDLSDPKTIGDFADLVKDQEHLDLLTVLTVCDIRGVGPNTWNNWKAVLLRELHSATSMALKEGGAQTSTKRRENEAKEALRVALADWPEEELDREIERHYGDYWLGLTTNVQVDIANMMRDMEGEEYKMNVARATKRDATRFSFVMADHPGLFARICGAMSLSGANIVDARTYTSSDGMATPVLWVQDDDGQPYDSERAEFLEKNVIKVLHGQVKAGDALAARAKIKKREREFRVPTRITFDNDGSKIFTIIEVDTRDRKGLLFDLSKTLSAANIRISSAIIATYGEQAVDSFYVKDVFGLKIHSASKQRQIEEKLRKAIEEGYQEAMG